MGFEELSEITVVQILHDDADRVVTAADAEDSSDVDVFEGPQNPDVSIEISPENVNIKIIMLQLPGTEEGGYSNFSPVDRILFR